MPLDRSSELEPTRDSSRPAGGLVDLDEQIRWHKEHDASRSYLGRAISAVWRKDESSLAELEGLRRQAEEARKQGDSQAAGSVEKRIQEQIKADREALALQDEISHYAGGFLKTAGLFLRGRVGLAGTVAAYALDQMNPRDSFKTQVADMTLGAAKGGLMKGAFHVLGRRNVGIAAKGVGLGVTSRALEFGLTRSTYSDNSGALSLSKGLAATVKGSLDRTALATDVVVFAGAHGLLKGVDRLAGGAIKASPLAGTMLTGTTFGFSSGTTGELLRQQQAGEELNVWRAAKRGLLQGTIDTFAAAPGGLQARSAMEASIKRQTQSREFVVTEGREALSRFDTQGQRAAWLKVKEVLGRKSNGQAQLGIERSLFVQHLSRSNAGKLAAIARQADLIATCFPELLSPANQAKHVFSSASGPVWLERSAAGERIRLSAGEAPPKSPGSAYEKATRLGDDLSPDIAYAMDRAETGDRNYRHIRMSEIGKISAKPSDKPKMILTSGLGGCTAVAVLIERANGVRTAIMSHEIAGYAEAQFAEIQRLARRVPGIFEEGTKKTALVLTAAGWEGDPFLGPGKGRTKTGVSADPWGESYLMEALRSKLGVQKVGRQTYSIAEFFADWTNDGILALKLTPGKPVTFKTWFNGEKAFDF